MSEFYAVLLVKNSRDNPDSLPVEWYRDARKSGPSLESSLEALGYTLMTADEFEKYQSDHADEFAENRASIELDKALSERSKLDALKRLFDDCEAIDDAWATATRAQKDDLAQKTFRILRKQRRQILDQYRPE